MRTSIKNLRRVIQEEIEATEPELRSIIAQMDPNQVADDDYFDTDTGEVYLEKGRRARSSELHPQYKLDRDEKRRARDIELAAEEESDRAEEEEWERSRAQAYEDAETAFQGAVREFASDWTGNEHSEHAADVAPDAAENFFYQYTQWKEWARMLGLSRDIIKSIVADEVYEAMTSSL